MSMKMRLQARHTSVHPSLSEQYYQDSLDVLRNVSAALDLYLNTLRLDSGAFTGMHSLYTLNHPFGRGSPLRGEGRDEAMETDVWK